jgi:uncharacterized protein
MHTYLRDKPVWMQLLIFGGLTAGIFFVVLFGGFTIVAHLNHLSSTQVMSMTSSDFAKPENATLIKELLVVQFFIFVLPALVFAYLSDPHPFYYAGLRPPQKKSFMWIALITIILAYMTVAFLSMINEVIVHRLPAGAQKWIMNGEDDANGPLENVLAMKNPGDLVKLFFLVGLLPAVGEELFFRGILQRLFIQIFKKPWSGIIFTGFLFSAFHMQFMGFLPRMALGIILGALYWYSGSLLASILGHFVFNSINVLFIYFKVADLDSQTNYSLGFAALGIFSVVGVVFLINYLRKNSLTRYSDEFGSTTEEDFIDNPDRGS